VVFFKGCPLRCRWCSNPESQKGNIQILWDAAQCRFCLRCRAACPRGAIRTLGNAGDGGFEIRRDWSRCGGCGLCAASCPGQALSTAGRRYSLDEVLEECLKDRAFYEESGGGVTLSGGEALVQADFAEALLRGLGEAGIHRAIETSGAVPRESFNRMIHQAELILFDIKHHRRDRHFEGTGVYNDGILENFRSALAAPPAVLPRIPVIPGYNDSLEDAAAFAELLTAAGARDLQLLPFHQFGRKKYAMLGMDYGFEQANGLFPEDLGEYRRVLESHGLRIIG
jgi:pyruvate formate lyase activating enzyme